MHRKWTFLVAVILALATSACSGVPQLTASRENTSETLSLLRRNLSRIDEGMNYRQFYMAGNYIIPDDVATRSQEYRESLQKRFRDLDISKEGGGWSCDLILLYIPDLEAKESENLALIRDPFCANGGFLRYALSREGTIYMIASSGPDGDIDLDLTSFDAWDDYGQPDSFKTRLRQWRDANITQIYDPTNGVKSGGDYLHAGGNWWSVNEWLSLSAPNGKQE